MRVFLKLHGSKPSKLNHGNRIFETGRFCLLESENHLSVTLQHQRAAAKTRAARRTPKETETVEAAPMGSKGLKGAR